MTPPRTLTQEQREDAARLMRAFLAAQRIDDALTQERLAGELGYKTQAAVSHYLTGRTALNLPALLAFCKALEVDPRDISPTLAAQLDIDALKSLPSGADTARNARNREVPMVPWDDIESYSTSGAAEDAELIACPLRHGPRAFATRVRGSAMVPRFQPGDMIFVDPDRPAVAGTYVLVRTGEGVVLRRLLEDGSARFLEASNLHWPTRVVPLRDPADIVGVAILRAEPPYNPGIDGAAIVALMCARPPGARMTESPTPPRAYTLPELVAEVKTELGFRAAVYPKLVAQGRLKPGAAAVKARKMQQILALLEELQRTLGQADISGADLSRELDLR